MRLRISQRATEIAGVIVGSAWCAALLTGTAWLFYSSACIAAEMQSAQPDDAFGFALMIFVICLPVFLCLCVSFGGRRQPHDDTNKWEV